MPLLVLASVVGTAALVHCLTKKDFCLCLFASVAGIVDVLYIAALLGQLQCAARMLFCLGLAAGAASAALVLARPASRGLVRALLSPGPVFFLAATAAFWACYSNATYRYWDEFMNWGLAAKEMLLTNSLPTGDTALSYQDYSRGTALFYYFVARNSFYSEGVTYFAHFILLAACFPVLFARWSWRESHWVGLTLLFVVLLNCIRGCSFRTLYVDRPLAAYTGVALVAYLTSQERPATTAFLVPVLFALPLIKKVGFDFALVCLAVMGADSLVRAVFGEDDGAGGFGGMVRKGAARIGRASRATRGYFARNKATAAAAAAMAGAVPLGFFVDGKLARQVFVILACVMFLISPRRWMSYAARFVKSRARGRAAVAALLIAAPFAAHGSWQWWVRTNQLTKSFTLSEPGWYNRVFAAFGPKAAKVEGDTGRAFMRALWNRQIGVGGKTLYARIVEGVGLAGKAEAPRLSAATAAIMLALLFGAAVWLAPGGLRKARIAATGAITIAAFGAYLFGLLANYLMTFCDYDGGRLLEFSRYAWTYPMAITYVAWGLVAAPRGARAAGAASSRATDWKAFAVALALPAYMYLFENSRVGILPPRSGMPPVEVRETIRTEMEFVKAHTREDDEIFVVCQDCDGFEMQVILYDLFPRRTKQRAWSLGARFREKHVWTANLTVEEWAKMLARYRYVFVARGDEQLWAGYGDLFDAGRKDTDFLFKVFLDQKKGVNLAPVR